MQATTTQFEEFFDMEPLSAFAGPAPLPAPGLDRFDRGARIVDALGVDLSLDARVLELDDLMN